MGRAVGVRQLKNEASALIDEVERGASVTITRRGTPVARLVPAMAPPAVGALIEAGRLEWSGRTPTLPDRTALGGDGPTLAELVDAGRGPR